MNRKRKSLQFKYALMGGCLSLVVFCVLLLLMNSYERATKQREEIETARRFSTFSTQAGYTVIEKKLLLQGYLAFLETTDLTEELSVNYLDHLLGKNDDLIRSVTSIKDTTIKWIYPLSNNQSAVGVDLATIEGQKDVVLRIKNEHIQLIQGPVDLVQGGQGIIIRMPVEKTTGEYYGQLSIVLDLAKIAQRLEQIAAFNELKVRIISAQNEKPILENQEVLSKQPMVFQINDSDLNWTVYAIPVEGWYDLTNMKIISIIASIIVAILTGFMLYYLLFTNERLNHVANRDPLTGLYNRRFLDEYQSIIFISSERYHKLIGFILLDLNGFKKINDQYGHKVGDEVLVNTARILNEQTRHNESIFRLGGDEFLILLPDLKNTDEIGVVIKRILKEFEKPLDVSDHQIIVTPSIGTAFYPADGNDFDQILHVADQQMYDQKRR